MGVISEQYVVSSGRGAGLGLRVRAEVAAEWDGDLNAEIAEVAENGETPPPGVSREP